MEYLGFAVELARAAGDVLKRYQQREKQIELKGRANLVTVADKESEALILREIRARYPDHAILTEESGTFEQAAAVGQGHKSRWIIDPLDGTTNYAHQFPFYCVSIGFEQNGEVLCGAVYDPVRDEMFSGSRGHGSHLNGERLRISETAKLHDALLLTGFPYGVREKLEVAVGQFRKFLVESRAVRRAGAAALDLCYLAIGRCDGFWEMDLNPWDTSAGLVIAEEAGARITDFRGNPFSIDSKEILASNGKIHSEMVRALGRLGTAFQN